MNEMTADPDWIREIIQDAARGKNSHADPREAVSGLDMDAVGRQTHDGVHSIWENLWHVVFWQRLLLDGVQGKPVAWVEQIGKDFPPDRAPESKEAWEKLVSALAAGVEETQRLATALDLSTEVPGWGGITVGYALMIAGTHCSYHTGQIIQTRIALRLWPPT
jgi:uncharacterized damage-inducible protein DinB